jgi:uncharacterized protein YbjT (DUF2867 family)
MILISTAGKVGAEAARLLAPRSPTRLVVRDRSRFGELAAAGVDLVEGDLDDAATVDAATRGVSGVVLVTAPSVGQEVALIDGAVRAGVGHVVKITSASSLDSPIARRRNQATIEEHLIASGLGFTLLRSNAYMQNLLMLAPAIRETGRFGSATGAARVGHVDARDVAAVAAEIAATPAEHAGRTYWPTGPQALDSAAMAATLADALGRPIAADPITVEQLRAGMIQAGLPEALADDNAKAVGLMADGDGDYVIDDVATILGRPPRTFAEFVADHRAAFTA